MTDTAIHWFRLDLRLRDNPALLAAAKHQSVLAVYIWDETIDDALQMGGASRWWLHHSLKSLNNSLEGQLVIYRGDPEQILQDLVKDTGACAVYWNRCYEPHRISADSKIKSRLTAQGTQSHSFNGSLMWEPMTILKADNTPYKVFTPYYRKGCLAAAEPRFPEQAPEQLNIARKPESSLRIDDLPLIPDIAWYDHMASLWQPGEQGASNKLSRYINEAAPNYASDRDIPSVEGTSKISPHLHFGELSPNQVWYAIKNNFPDCSVKSIDKYLAELGWREFSYYLLYHFPKLPTQNFNARFDNFPWLDAPEYLQAWQKGMTGVPIIDAGMRELWQTGYMHNRVRMVVGSFLVKNLLTHWQSGAAWFHDCLVDADLASNSASWQWVAGSGADAAPYFRIFNPILQGEKFDKQGVYVKKYCPELSALPNKYIHKPWEAPEDVLKLANIKLGEHYPKPIIDLKQSRQRALDAFQEIKSN